MDTEAAIAATIQLIQSAKSEWLATQMKRVCPPEIYALAHTTKPSDRMKVARWLSANKVSLREWQPTHSDWTKVKLEANGSPDPPFNKSELMVHGKVISLMSFRLKDFKLEVMVKDFNI